MPSILASNPGVNPYNLQIGDTLTICPGADFEPSPEPPEPDGDVGDRQRVLLSNAMRQALSQNVYWMRMLIISIAARLGDTEAVAARLMKNPADIATVFAGFYTRDTADMIERIVTEHVQTGVRLITALRDGDTGRAEALSAEWYQNADDFADLLGRINPHYNVDDLRLILRVHLDLTRREADMRLAGNYAADIETFNAIEAEAMDMADALVIGLTRQFPQRFQ